MASAIAFESTSDKKTKRKQLREARQQIIDNAKQDYEKEQWRKEQAKLRGEDTWMLPALSDRLEREQKEFEKKSKKAKKEKKRKKKHKKEKKKKKSDVDSSSEDSNDEPVWVEKESSVGPSRYDTTAVVKGPQLQRDSWMESPLDLIPTLSKKDILEQKRQEKEKEKNNEPNLLDMPGRHERELNPYWKDGGTGLPEEKPKTSTSVGVGDGGLSWMKKAYERCVEQAKEEGRTLEDVATEKYGSLRKLEKMLSDAEKANQKVTNQQIENRLENSYRQNIRKERSRSKERYIKRSRSRSGDRKEKYRRTSRSKSKERTLSSNYRKFKRPSKSRSKSPYDRKYRKSSRSRSRSIDKRRSRSPNYRKYKRPSRSRSKSPTRKKDYRSRSPHDRTSYRRNRSRSPRYGSRRSRSKSPRARNDIRSGRNPLSNRFKRPNDSDEEMNNRSLQQSKNRFVKPDNSDEEPEYRDGKSVKYSSRRSDIPAWKKKEYIEKDKRKEDEQKEVKRKEPTPSDSSSSSSSESSESEESEEEKPKLPEVKILTEQEMNQLGAKIVRAELMGDEDLAVKLKEELEKARELRERNKTEVPSGDRKQAQVEEDNVVVLTRTDMHGRVMPLPERTTDDKPSGKRKRKKQKVETHGKKGERKQYFDDDDNYDLKTLVEREKLGTAEDNNKMFARLAQRSSERTSDDYQIDDQFLTRAANKQTISVSEMKERSKAIADHQKMAGKLEKCQFCFGNVAKHLIIAIGTKSYLSLPNHKSLTEGHCLIIPMHHSASSTVVDEDVWEEIQTFRKTLVRMFQEEDEDVIFMETSMKFKHYPHMHIECIPVPKETGDMAPIYFKKAIQESEHEWSDNKKLVDLKNRNVRKAIPKGFPYFSVDFGNDGGFAHVIEDEQSFPYYFGREILGGMLDAEPQLWRKPSRENFDDQRKKVLKFAEKWKSYDWTQKPNKGDDESS